MENIVRDNNSVILSNDTAYTNYLNHRRSMIARQSSDNRISDELQHHMTEINNLKHEVEGLKLLVQHLMEEKNG